MNFEVGGEGEGLFWGVEEATVRLIV